MLRGWCTLATRPEGMGERMETSDISLDPLAVHISTVERHSNVYTNLEGMVYRYKKRAYVDTGGELLRCMVLEN